ncbi:MAG: DUF4149 domain-containing protein, partial [Aquificaceae bacterium]|nr:DUF4149 domain-containing protein [Aquificaceae bacterium]
DRLLLLFNSAYLGLGSFFSFFVAPTLFRVLQREQAGAVVEKVFPVYFTIGFLVCLVSFLVGFFVGRLIILLSLANLVLHTAHLFYILPTAHSLKQVDYGAFMKWHGISMTVNIISLLLTLILCILLLRR